MKKKIFAIVLCIAMLAIAVVGGTMAYFTDSHTQTNTFTAGKVGISLDEAVVKPDADETSKTFGDLIPDGDKRTDVSPAPYHLFPGMSVAKDPTITVDSDSENAYLAAIVTVTFDKDADLDVLRKNGICLDYHHDMLNVGSILTGEFIGNVLPKTDHPLDGKNDMHVYGNDKYSVYQIADSANRKFTIYMFFEGAKTKNTKVTLFNTIEIPETWNNADMAALNGMKIDVAAYAVQASGFTDCYKAMSTAFKDVFPQAN